MKLLDIIGFPLPEALTIMDSIGYEISETLTTKPASVNIIDSSGVARVVRVIKQGDAKLQIVVAYEDYLKGGV